MSEKEYIGVTYADDCLKSVLVRLSPIGQKIQAASKKDVAGLPPEELPRSAHTVLSGLGGKRTSVVYAVPANIVTTKNIEIPSVDPTEIQSIIDLQAGRHTPYSREEIIIGYITIGTFQRNYTKVLLIIVNRDQLLKQVGIFVQAGAKVEKVIFAPEAVAGLYVRILKLKEGDKPVGVLDVARNTTDFMVLWNRTVITSRSIPVGLTHLIKEGKEAQDRLSAELAKSLEIYQNEDISTLPEEYVLTSDDAKVQELVPVLQTKLKCNVRIVPYLDQVEMSPAVKTRLVSEYNDDSLLSVVAGAGLADQVKVDLTPAEIKTQRAIEEKGKQLIYAAIFGLVLLTVTGIIFFSKIYFKGLYLEKLSEDNDRKVKEVATLDRIAQRSRIIKDYASQRMATLESLKTLYRLIPEEMYLQSVILEEDGSINIQGTSESMSLVFNLVKALEESDQFKNVEPKSTATKQERGKDVAVFEITFKLTSAPDAPEGEEGEDKDKDAAKPAGEEKKEEKAEKK